MKSRFLLRSIFGFSVVLFTSCGGIKYYKHPTLSKRSHPQASPLDPVVLNAGEKVKLLKHTRGMIIGGGYIEGVVIEDPTLVAAHYGKAAKSDRFAPLVTVTGLKSGSTRAVYCNRLGERPNFTQPLPSDFQARSFLIRVK